MSQNHQKLARRSSITSLRNQRSPCKCQWCAKPAAHFGKLRKQDLPISSRRSDNSGYGKSLSIISRTRLPLIGNSSGSESATKQSASTDSDVQESPFVKDLSASDTYYTRKFERTQIEESVAKRIAGPRSDRGYSSKTREPLSGSDEGGSPHETIVDASHEYSSKEVFDEKCPQLQRAKYRDEYGDLPNSEDVSPHENFEDGAESSSSLNVEKARSDGDCDGSDDQEVREIFFGGARVRVPRLCDSRRDQDIESEESSSLSGYTSDGSLSGSNSSRCLTDDCMQRSQHRLSDYRSEGSSSSSEAVDLGDLTVKPGARSDSDDEMPSEKESKMNLSALKQVDPEINEIVDSAAQVALYQYSTQTGQWAKTEVEGALYVYAHRNAHQRGLIILNRNSPKNYKEPIRADIEFKIKTPFLIYKTTAGHIFGAWFYVEEECTRVGNLCCRLVSYLKKRGRNESGSQADNNNQQQGISILQNLLPPSALPKVDAQSGANIMSLLKKAEGGSAQVSNGNSNGSSNHSNHHPHNGNITQHHQNGKSKKQPLTPNNSNHNDSGSRQQENGRHRKATGDTTPGVPVVHKPVPTKSLPSSVEQLFKSAANPQQQQQKKQQQQQQQGSSSSSTSVAAAAAANKHYSPMPESTTPKTPRGAQNGGGGGDLERLLGDLSRSSLESPPPSVALVETKVEALTPLNPCMASILSKLNESAQKVQREAEMARNSPTTEEALLRAFKGPLPNNIGLEKKLTLITPEMLEESLSQGPSTPPQTLSRYELKSALLHLLDTDDDFLTKIHNAYVQGVSRRKL